MEVLDDGRIAARRCLEAISETQDIETKAALWKAALRYAEKARMNDVAGLAGWASPRRVQP